MKVPRDKEDNRGWKSMKTSVWAGAYTEEFAEAILQGAEGYLKERFEENGKIKVNAVFAGDELPIPIGKPVTLRPSVEEETAMHPDVDEEREDIENWSEEELPESTRAEVLRKVPQEIRRSVRRAHRGLGHPTRKAFLKMLRLANSTEKAIQYAKEWNCPTCAASATPGQPLESTTRTRPFGFNESVGMDVKYLKDKAGKQLEVLSMVDFGTSWHAATILKNRNPNMWQKCFLRNGSHTMEYLQK